MSYPESPLEYLSFIGEESQPKELPPLIFPLLLPIFLLPKEMQFHSGQLRMIKVTATRRRATPGKEILIVVNLSSKVAAGIRAGKRKNFL